jgi:hypothetical protein
MPPPTADATLYCQVREPGGAEEYRVFMKPDLPKKLYKKAAMLAWA